MIKHVRTMRSADKFPISLCALTFIVLAGCSRMATPPSVQIVKDADALAANGDFLLAISLYESALDNSAQAADIHYKMALLYDEKMKDPLHAMHHFKRYLTLAPSGPHAEEVKGFMQRDELTLLTTLSGDSVVSRAEAARLRNENLNLRKELDDMRVQSQNAEKAAARTSKKKAAAPPKRTTQR